MPRFAANCKGEVSVFQLAGFHEQCDSQPHLFRPYLMGTGIVYFAMNGRRYLQVRCYRTPDDLKSALAGAPFRAVCGVFGPALCHVGPPPCDIRPPLHQFGNSLRESPNTIHVSCIE
jgi:hypothetical protein